MDFESFSFPRRVNRDKGVTLIELLVTVVVLGILSTIAAPSFLSFLEKQRLLGSVQGAANFIKLARAESLKRSTGVAFVVDRVDSMTWCYGLTDNVSLTCDCFIENSCSVGSKTYENLNTEFPNIKLSSVTPSNSVSAAFESTRGTINPTVSMVFETESGNSLELSTTLLGSSSICSSTGSFGGYDEC